MPSVLTVAERIILHLSQYSKLQDNYDVPIDVSQDGIAAALRISRAHAAIELKKLKDGQEVMERLAHIRRGKTKRKVYFLVPKGEARAGKIKEFAISEGIEIMPLLDLKKCAGEDLWKSTDGQFRPILAQACVFRKAFKRSVLPETSISLLPTDRNGMVEMPEDLRDSIVRLQGKEDLRMYHSFAADYWLKDGDNRERLYHLIRSGRLREAEMLVAARGQHLVSVADEDLFSIISALENPSDKYRHKVLFFAAEIARKTGHKDFCERVARRMGSSDSLRERSDGKLMLGLLAMGQGRHQDAYAILTEARELSSGNGTDPRLECEIAEALANLSRNREAKETLESLLPSQLKKTDPEHLERIYFQLGTLYLREGNGPEAVKCMSKSLGLTRSSDKAKFYRGLSDAYALAGMREKSAEFASKAQPPRKWGSSSAGQYR